MFVIILIILGLYLIYKDSSLPRKVEKVVEQSKSQSETSSTNYTNPWRS